MCIMWEWGAIEESRLGSRNLAKKYRNVVSRAGRVGSRFLCAADLSLRSKDHTILRIRFL